MGVSNGRGPLLAALNFADELERLRREHQALLTRLETLSERLSQAVER